MQWRQRGYKKNSKIEFVEMKASRSGVNKTPGNIRGRRALAKR